MAVLAVSILYLIFFPNLLHGDIPNHSKFVEIGPITALELLLYSLFYIISRRLV